MKNTTNGAVNARYHEINNETTGYKKHYEVVIDGQLRKREEQKRNKKNSSSVHVWKYSSRVPDTYTFTAASSTYDIP